MTNNLIFAFVSLFSFYGMDFTTEMTTEEDKCDDGVGHSSRWVTNITQINQQNQFGLLSSTKDGNLCI